MKKLLLTTLLCFCVNAYAFNWKLLPHSLTNTIFFYDVDSVEKHDGFIYFWELANFLDKPYEGVSYSYIAKHKLDCKQGKVIILSTTFYSKKMGKGRITDESNAPYTTYPKPGSVGYMNMKPVCKKFS